MTFAEPFFNKFLQQKQCLIRDFHTYDGEVVISGLCLLLHSGMEEGVLPPLKKFQTTTYYLHSKHIKSRFLFFITPLTMQFLGQQLLLPGLGNKKGYRKSVHKVGYVWLFIDFVEFNQQIPPKVCQIAFLVWNSTQQSTCVKIWSVFSVFVLYWKFF